MPPTKLCYHRANIIMSFPTGASFAARLCSVWLMLLLTPARRAAGLLKSGRYSMPPSHRLDC